MKQIHIFLLLFLSWGTVVSVSAESKQDARRISVLFFGAPTAAHSAHDPISRYRVLKKNLGLSGIDLTYSEDPAEALNPETLKHHDAILMYGNWEQHGTLVAVQEKALLDFVNQGGGFLPIHCASACYGGSKGFVKLVGGRFKSHTTGVFSPKTCNGDHAITKDYEGFSAWDETYVHDQHADDRTILQTRENEPWTWTRKQGKGRVFYTASGHDHRVWNLPQFHELLKRAIYWAVGDDAKAGLEALGLPKLRFEKAILPGYRNQKTIETYQLPLSPEESLKLAQVPPGFELSLFAHEPDIVNPISVNWDEKGRAFVIETIDYPNNLQAKDTGHDRITICEDTNGDGAADKFTRFAENLSIPTSLIFTQGGVICTNGTQLLFLKDTDGDDKADVRQVVFEGFKVNDTHAGVSNLHWGMDNWIYVTIGYAGFEGTVGNKKHEFNTGLFRLRLDPKLSASAEAGKDNTLQHLVELEFLQHTTNNTWGLGFTQDFDILISTANANPSMYFTFPEAIYKKAKLKQPRTPRADDNPLFFPSSDDIRQVDVFGGYTAAAGHAVYTAHRFPALYQNKIAFICAPTGKLIGQFRLTPKGSGFTSTQLPNNIYNSADTWSAPVAAEVGPDGALWVCDWYNIIIQHNPTPSVRSAGYDAKNGKGNAYVTPLRDKQHGRIYRISPKGSQDETTKDSLFWQITQQRKAIESAVAPEKSTTLIDFYTLQTLGKLDAETIKKSLASENPALRRIALRYAPLDDTVEKLFIKNGVITDSDARVRLEIYLALARLSPSESIAAALYRDLTPELIKDQGLYDAWQIAARRNAYHILLTLSENPSLTEEVIPKNLFPNPDFSEVVNGQPTHWNKLLLWGDNMDPNTVTLSSDPTGGRNGSPALKITAAKNTDCGAVVAIKVEANSRYKVTAWIKTKDIKPKQKGGIGCLINIHGDQRSKGLIGTNDWTQVGFDFISEGAQEITLHCLFGGYGGATGTAWWDDVSLTKTSSSNPKINASQQLSTYFGQTAAPEQKAKLLTILREKKSPLAQIIAAQSNTPVKVVRKHVIDPATHKRGKAVYSLTCIACHGPDGSGVAGAFPPLDASPWLTGDAALPAKIILHGLQGPFTIKGNTYTSIMPPVPNLTDKQIADVLTFARQSWSNDASAVTPEQVKKTRAATSAQTKPYTVKELK